MGNQLNKTPQTGTVGAKRRQALSARPSSPSICSHCVDVVEIDRFHSPLFYFINIVQIFLISHGQIGWKSLNSRITADRYQTRPCTNIQQIVAYHRVYDVCICNDRALFFSFFSVHSPLQLSFILSFFLSFNLF